MNTVPKHCAKCGGTLAPESALSVCPRCVAAQVLEPDTPVGVERTAGPSPLVACPLERVGDSIGRYKLREKIGEGGCGLVYVAEQTEPVRRRVALKVIKLGMDTRAVVARFEAERQALALIDPDVAATRSPPGHDGTNSRASDGVPPWPENRAGMMGGENRDRVRAPRSARMKFRARLGRTWPTHRGRSQPIGYAFQLFRAGRWTQAFRSGRFFTFIAGPSHSTFFPGPAFIARLPRRANSVRRVP